MADLFTLMGQVSISTKEANDQLDALIAKAGTLANTLNGGTTVTIGGTSGTGTQTTGTTVISGVGTGSSGTTGATSTTSRAWSVTLGNLATQAINKAYSVGKSFFQSGFQRNQNLEKWTASYKTFMGGDEKAANAFVEELQKFAVDTPLSLTETFQTANKLLASGIDSGNVINTLRMLGDVAQGDTEKMSRLGLVYSQVMGGTKLGGNDPTQFREAGVPIYDLLEQYYAAQDITYEGTLLDLQKKGGILPEHVHGALYMSTQPGGMYYNAMNNAMDTEYGKAQKLKDGFEQMAGNVTKELFNVFSDKTIPEMEKTVTELNDWATENSDSVGKAAEGVSSLATSVANIGAKTITGLTGFLSAGGSGDPIAGGAMLSGLGLTLSGLLKGNVKHGLWGGGLMVGATASSFNQMMNAFAEQGIDNVGEAFDVAQTNLENQSTILHYMTKTGAFAEKGKDDEKEYLRETSWYEKAMLGLAGAFGLDDAKHNMEEAWGLVQKEEKETFPEEEGNIGGSLKQLNENMHNMNMLFASRDGMPSGGFSSRGDVNMGDGADGNDANVAALASAISSLQASISSLASLESTLAGLPAQVEAAASAGTAAGAAAGVGSISVTGTVTTGTVMLNTGAIVGSLTPKLDLSLGSLYRNAAR